MKGMIGILVGLWLLPAAAPAQAQEAFALYAGFIKTKGYVVGAPLTASGLHRFEGDTLWTLVGWNHPRISGIAYDPAHPSTLFLAAGNGALRTLDGGASWRITTDWRMTEVQDVALDPNTPQQVYLATPYGVWRTTDQGASWEEANAGLRRTYVETIEVDRTQAGRVVAGTTDGVYTSSDQAHTWTRAGPPDVFVLDLQQSPTHPQRWLAATEEHGLLLSDDGARSWHVAQGPFATSTFHAVAIDPSNPQYMAAAGWGTGVYVSTDGGASWTREGTALPTPHFYEVVFDANVPQRLWAATLEQGLYVSDDLGRTWTYAGLYGTLVFDMVFIPTGDP